MGIAPHHTMQIAERLYTSGFISYPRTESSGYPPGFEFDSTLSAHSRHPIWGEYAHALYSAGVHPPKVGLTRLPGTMALDKEPAWCSSAVAPLFPV